MPTLQEQIQTARDREVLPDDGGLRQRIAIARATEKERKKTLAPATGIPTGAAPAAPSAPQAAPGVKPESPQIKELHQDAATVLDELAIRKHEKQFITAPGAGYPLHVEDERAILSTGEDIRKWSLEQIQKRQEVLQGQVEGLRRQGATELPEPEAAQPHGVTYSDLQDMIEKAEANPRIPDAVKAQVRDLLSPAVAPEAGERAGKVGVAEKLVRKDWAAWLPVVGVAFDVAHMRRTKEAAERLQEEEREPGFYKELEDREMTGTLRAAFGGPLRTADARQAADEAIVTRFLLDVAETDARGVTWPAVIAEGVVNLLPYMIEFALTAGAAEAAKGAVQTGSKVALRKLGANLAGRFAKRIAASKGAAVAARLTNMAARAAIGGAVRAPMWGAAEIEQRQIPVMELGRRGKIIFQREGETPAQAVLHGLLSGWIEGTTEEMGQEIFGPLGRAAADKLAAKVPLIGKLLSHLDDLRGKVPRLAALSKSAGYSDLISEMGEEQAGRTIRAVIGLEPPGSMDEAKGMLERLAASVPSVSELLTEGAVLAAPALLRLGAGVAAQRKGPAPEVPPAPKAAPLPAAPTPGSRADLVAQVAAMREAGEPVTPETVSAKLAVGRDVAVTLIGEVQPTPPAAAKPSFAPAAYMDFLRANSEKMKALTAEKEAIETEVINGTRYLKTPKPEDVPRLQAIYDELSALAKKGDEALEQMSAAGYQAAAAPAFPQTPADAARALRIFQIYNETGNEAILEDLPPGAMIRIDTSTLSLDLAKTLKTPRERKAFQQRLVKAAELVESGEATREELSKEAAAYQQVWGEADPLPDGLLRYIGLSELAAPAEVKQVLVLADPTGAGRNITARVRFVPGPEGKGAYIGEIDISGADPNDLRAQDRGIHGTPFMPSAEAAANALKPLLERFGLPRVQASQLRPIFPPLPEAKGFQPGVIAKQPGFEPDLARAKQEAELIRSLEQVGEKVRAEYVPPPPFGTRRPQFGDWVSERDVRSGKLAMIIQEHGDFNLVLKWSRRARQIIRASDFAKHYDKIVADSEVAGDYLREVFVAKDTGLPSPAAEAAKPPPAAPVAETEARRALTEAGWTVEENPAWAADPENENRYIARATDRTTGLAIESAEDTVGKMLQGLREAEMLDRATPPTPAAKVAPAAEAAAEVPPEAPPAAPPVAPEKPSPVEERLGRWLQTQSGGQLAKTARTMGIAKRPDIATAMVKHRRAAEHLREARATINEARVDAELDRLGIGAVETPLLDWLKGDRICAWKGLAYATEIKEACAGRPALARMFVFKKPSGVLPPGGHLDQDAESAASDPDSGFRGTGPSEFLDQLTREADLRATTGDVRNLPLPQKLERLARAAREAGDERAAGEYERQMNLVLQAQEWESESTDALREAVGRYVETKAPGAGLEWAKATPAAREAAEQLGVRLGEVTPTGKDGAILERDVRRAALTRDKETTARVRGLRQKIRAVVAERGLPETEWRELAKEVSGHRHLAATRVTEEHLEEILRRVQAARPQQIRRGTGFVQVIRPKTEQKIQTLRERLGTIGQMTDEDFGNILAGMKIQEPRYVSAQNFVTEAQGHDVLRAMLDAAPSIGKRTARESALAFPHEGAPPNVREAWETADRQIKEKAKKVAEKPHPVHVRPLWDMRYYSQFWEEKTGAPVSEAVQEVLDARAGIERDVETGIHDRLAQAIGEKELARLTADPAACRRIEDWLASELKRGGPEKPADVTPTEVKAAETIRDILRDYETPVRIARFYDYWENDAKIPDATPEQLQEATDILETQGHEALERHLATQTWGTIETGYTPLSVVRAKVRTYQLPPTALGKGHLQSRGGLYLEQERTIFQRLNSYAYQILGLTRLRRPIRSFVQVFDQASGQMKSPGKVASVFSTWLDEIKGYPARYHPMSAFVRRVYAQAMTAVVLIDPRKWVRNKFQNLAFYPDRTDFLNPRNKTLTPEDREYFRKHVSQRFGLLQHYFMSAEKPFWGFRHITEWARKLSLYPLTDETNRWECFWAKINRVRRALAAHPQDAEAMQKAANMMDLELVQRREALRILAADGPDAMARYVASQVTYNVHFAYDRAMRAPIEQGDVGRILGNLMTFPRSYGQQLALSARQITHGETPGVRLRGFKKFVNLIVGATVAGWLFQLITGDKNNPYNPMNVLRWNMGGLSVGAVQEGFETMGDIMQAVKGDRQALDRLAIGIPRCADLFVPFYRQLTNAAEGVTGYKDLDRLALRKVRALVDKRYGGPQTERYKVDRNAVQIMQKILMGVEAHDAKQAAQVPADSISKIRAAIRERQEAQETDLQERIKAGQPRTQIMAEFVRQQPQKDRDRLRDRTDLLLAYKNVDPWWKRLEGMPTIESRAMAFAERYEAANANEQKRLLALLRKLPGLVPKEEKSRDRFWATFRRHLNDLKTGKAKP